MKRFLALLLALTLAISLTACNTQPKPFYTDAEDVPASDLKNCRLTKCCARCWNTRRLSTYFYIVPINGAWNKRQSIAPR